MARYIVQHQFFRTKNQRSQKRIQAGFKACSAASAAIVMRLCDY